MKRVYGIFQVFVFVAMVGMLSAQIPWTYVTGAASITAVADAPGSGRKIRVKSMLVSVANACNLYFMQGTAQVGPRFYVAANGTLAFDNLGIELPENAALSIWADTNPGTTKWMFQVERLPVN